MKRHVVKSSMLAGVVTLLFALPNFSKGDLKDIAKPHLGIYECKIARVDETDYLEHFSYIRLELKDGGRYELAFREKEGAEKRKTGKYRYDEKRETLTLYLDDVGIVKKEFPLKKGILSVQVALGEKTMCLQFEQK